MGEGGRGRVKRGQSQEKLATSFIDYPSVSCYAAYLLGPAFGVRYMIGPSQNDLESEQMTKVCDNDGCYPRLSIMGSNSSSILLR